MVIDIIEGNNITEYSEPEIVILLETKEFLLRRFLITYDSYREAYKEFFYVAKDIDTINAYAFILRTSGPRNFNLSDLIGLSTDEIYDEFLSFGYNMEHYKKVLELEGALGYTYSISEVYEGYELGESYVYIQIENDAEDIIGSITYKYHFRTIEGDKKIFIKNMVNSQIFRKSGNKTIDEFYEKTKVYYHRKNGEIFEEVLVDFPISFDINNFVEKYYNYHHE